MGDTCPDCGKEYDVVAHHWRQSSCDRPGFTDHQREIITGMLMGDGSINRSNNGNPFIQSNMISPNYLEYVDDQFGIFGKGVSLSCTAAESAKWSRDSGFDPEACEENYSDLYTWWSMAHPELQEFAEWYSTGKKVWPDNIELTPTVLKHWYCGDGSYNSGGRSNRIEIGMSNEINNTDKINLMFEDVRLPSPSNYDISKRKDGSMNCIAQFQNETSHELWEYMGEPLPDFEYKWPEQYR